MKSDAKTPEAYLDTLPPERRETVGRLRATLKENLPEGFEETMGYGMLAYVVPHRLYPGGYHCDPKLPLPFINVASQKQHVALYHMGLYDGPLLEWLRAQWPKATTRKLDLGKCCVRFKWPAEIPFELVGRLARRMTPRQWIAAYEAALKR